jgi:tetratricopeptide (TPR) repeat protein
MISILSRLLVLILAYSFATSSLFAHSGTHLEDEGFKVYTDRIGKVDFPTSAKLVQAQKHFERGVAILHSFGWKQAIKEFRKAQEIEPDFAMAYWGESLCYSPPLRGERDRITPQKILNKLGKTSAQRIAKAPTKREKDLLMAVDVLFFGEADLRQRRESYAHAMGQLHKDYPEDDEIGLFYVLSLMSSVVGVSGEPFQRANVLAGSIALKVYNENPDSPGAAHYTIHAFDDPIHAPLALAAAKKYAAIATSVSHGLHMPSHIFIQHGMWQDVSDANQVAYDLAVELWQPGDNANDLLHSLDWGHYADLQLGDLNRAQKWMQMMQTFADKTAAAGQQHEIQILPLVKARYIIETEQWQTTPMNNDSHFYELFATGVSAVKQGNLSLAQKAEARLHKILRDMQGGVGSYKVRNKIPVQLMHLELSALIALAEGNKDVGIQKLEEAVKISENRRLPNGTANPIKPVHELFGEVLFGLGEWQEAEKMFQRSLQRITQRPRSILGLARVYAKLGKLKLAKNQYKQLLDIWGDRKPSDWLEVNQYLKQN